MRTSTDSVLGRLARAAQPRRPCSRRAAPGAGRARTAVEAILRVGGKGTRLRSLTVTTPKPMLRIAGVRIGVSTLVGASNGNSCWVTVNAA